MKKLIVFLGIFLFADVSDTILKIKEIQNIKKSFLPLDYNIFGEKKKKRVFYKPKVVKKIKYINKKNINLQIYAIFNNKINLNGKWYKKGDVIKGFKIIKILDNGVLLKSKSEIKMLKIKESVLKVNE